MKQLMRKIKALSLNKSPFVLAIDGMSASGKTTLSLALQENLDASVFHMDDFFLPQQEQNLGIPGGNMDFARFEIEVLKKLDKDITFHRFDCKSQTYMEDFTTKKRIIIIEGAYALHPKLGKYYDYSIFLKIRKDSQKHRIEKRNKEMVDIFLNQWVRLEEEYFSIYEIEEKCDEVILNE